MFVPGARAACGRDTACACAALYASGGRGRCRGEGSAGGGGAGRHRDRAGAGPEISGQGAVPAAGIAAQDCPTGRPYDHATRTRRAPSNRWRRTQARIGRVHAHAAAVRHEVLHKATTTLAQQHRVVTVETLGAAGMRSKGGARKRGLNRALADAALAEIRRMATRRRGTGRSL
ncbi:transposase [Rhodococcus opacus]|uniref:transposase n=1 Tax=Rhodococcus opacus TaxID=37919 RepID=UPI00358E21E2